MHDFGEFIFTAIFKKYKACCIQSEFGYSRREYHSSARPQWSWENDLDVYFDWLVGS